MRIAFSNLACPEWSIEQVAEHGAQYGYAGVELRLYDGSVVQADMADQERARIRAACDQSGLTLIGIGASTRFTSPDRTERMQQEETLIQYVELAHDLGASFVRTFGGDFTQETKEESLSRVSDSLARVAAHVAGSGVQVLLETHDGFSHSSAVAEVLRRAEGGKTLGAIWDLHHPVRMGESVAYTYEQLSAYLRHVHIKDAIRDGVGGWTLVPLGTGDVPVRDIMQTLQAAHYESWLTVEWERAWHMELAVAQTALPFELQVLKSWLSA
ncbi:MAG: sugar phosphate isomerase/epimerase [Firmicutes bacterium]|nr:sugar phosphate isomerase/epimerase [Bacillota bacterium]